MARTTTEHESILDVFDNLLALGYLYESELADNPDLKQLQKLGAEAVGVVGHPVYCMLFQDDLAKSGAVCEVMNRLQRACRLKASPTTTVDLEWAGLPDAMEGFELQRMHLEQEDRLASLLIALVDRIDTAFPSETKPFVTPEQAKALLRSLRDGPQTPADFKGPVQVDVLSRLAHQEFLASLGKAGEPGKTFLTPERAHELARMYVRKAERSFADMVRESFLVAIVTKLYPRAQRLRLGIDKAYPWGALWRQPLPARDCLDLYAQLNHSGAIRDAKCTLEIEPGAGIPATEFIGWGRMKVPSPTQHSQQAVARKYFKSDDADLHINGEPVQKHAVMSVPYDCPLHDVERTLRHFRNYLLHQRREYCSASGETLNSEEAALAKLVIRDLQNNTKPERAVLHDKSGVLGHLCALMEIEMLRDPVHAATSKKVRLPMIEKWVSEAGFRYSDEAVRKSCARGPTEILALRSRFVDV